ncbi:MAG: hypothetical protein ACYC2O_05725 [Microthrixaceae bacterium]
MGELLVRSGEQRVRLMEGESLGFGRVNTEPGGSKGWGYEGRFLELGEQSYVHRIWAELLWNQGLWRVRSLGARHPVVVVPANFRPVELPPLRPGSPPHEFAVTQQEFRIVLSVAADTYELECASPTEVTLPPAERALSGRATVSLGDELAAGITATELRVLWVLAREYRTPEEDGAVPAPLSYARICRALGLSEKQAVSAVERVVKRLRSAQVMLDTVPAAQQRDWLCRQLVVHGGFEVLCDRHGIPDTD